MKEALITSKAELERAKKRLERIEGEIMDLEDEIGDLHSEQEQLEEEIERFERTPAPVAGEESAAHQLWKHVQQCWNRFTWTEHRIAERAAKGEELEREELQRFRLLCMQELHLCEGGGL